LTEDIVAPPRPQHPNTASGPRCPTLAELPPPPPYRTGWPWTAESAIVPETTPGGFRWPRLTVVTPSYNQAAFLEATIRSVLLQGYPDLEYIVIDGGSSDASQDIIEMYRPWLSHVVSEPDDGQYSAINKGFGMSTGAVMTWLNSDDMFVPNSLWAVGGMFGDLGHAVHWLTGVPAMWDRDDHLGLILRRPKLNQVLLRLGSYDGLTLNFIQQEGTFWTRDLWERCGGHLNTSLALAADYELWCRFAEHAELYAASALLAGFRTHAQQKTAHSMRRYMEDMEACRAARPWGWTEQYWLARGIKRRIARLMYRVGRDGNRVLYDPSALRWRIDNP
jgi:glycosyltransferase involved in cell wall biosynthesis